MIAQSCSLLVVIFIGFVTGSAASQFLLNSSTDSTSPKFFTPANVVDSSATSQSDSDTALPFPSLIKLKNFAIQSLLGSNTSIGNDGKTFLKSMIYSMITSTGSIRAIEHLETLKSTLLNQFHKKARQLMTGKSDVARDHGHGGIGFPSLEGALLSLAFLTFAVFLIDLIQQLVSRYRTGYTVPIIGRKRRSLTEHPRSDDHDNFHPLTTLTTTVLSAIENPLFLNSLYDL